MRDQYTPFFVAAVCFRRELDDSVQRNLDVRQVGLGKIMEIRVAVTTKANKWAVMRRSPVTKIKVARTDNGG